MKEFDIDGKKHYYHLRASLQDEMERSEVLPPLSEFAQKCLNNGARKAKVKIDKPYSVDDADDLLDEDQKFRDHVKGDYHQIWTIQQQMLDIQKKRKEKTDQLWDQALSQAEKDSRQKR